MVSMNVRSWCLIALWTAISSTISSNEQVVVEVGISLNKTYNAAYDNLTSSEALTLTRAVCVSFKQLLQNMTNNTLAGCEVTQLKNGSVKVTTDLKIQKNSPDSKPDTDVRSALDADFSRNDGIFATSLSLHQANGLTVIGVNLIVPPPESCPKSCTVTKNPSGKSYNCSADSNPPSRYTWLAISDSNPPVNQSSEHSAQSAPTYSGQTLPDEASNSTFTYECVATNTVNGTSCNTTCTYKETTSSTSGLNLGAIIGGAVTGFLAGSIILSLAKTVKRNTLNNHLYIFIPTIIKLKLAKSKEPKVGGKPPDEEDGTKEEEEEKGDKEEEEVKDDVGCEIPQKTLPTPETPPPAYDSVARNSWPYGRFKATDYKFSKSSALNSQIGNHPGKSYFEHVRYAPGYERNAYMDYQFPQNLAWSSHGNTLPKGSYFEHMQKSNQRLDLAHSIRN